MVFATAAEVVDRFLKEYDGFRGLVRQELRSSDDASDRRSPAAGAGRGSRPPTT